MARWSQRLSTYDYELIHRPGRKHQVPDALSRLVGVQDVVDGKLTPIDDVIPHYDDPAFVVSRSQREKQKERARAAAVTVSKASPPIEDPPSHNDDE